MKKRIISWLLTAAMAIVPFGLAGCDEDTPDSSTSTPSASTGEVVEDSTKYTIDEKYFLGMGDVVYETRYECDPSTSKEVVSEASKIFGAKTQRVWAPFIDICDRAENSDELLFRSDIVAQYKAYFNMLVEKGVDRIVFLSYNYPLPSSVQQSYSISNFRVPDFEKDYDAYVDYLNIIYDFYYQVASLFPNVHYFEVGNEWDISGFTGYLRDLDHVLYDATHVGVITADIMWYANRAVKAVNPNNKILFPGPSGGTMSMFEDCAQWFDVTMNAIESQRCPTGTVDPKTGEYLYASVNPNSYFQIATMHPYPYNLRLNGEKSLKAWINEVQSCYDVLVRHKYPVKVWFTEFGLPDQYVDDKGNNAGWTDEDIANDLPKYLDAIRENFKWAETVILFRTYGLYLNTWNPRENAMGVFHSPDDPVNPAKPKQTAITVYKYMMEKVLNKPCDLNPETSPLYWYYNAHKPSAQ